MESNRNPIHITVIGSGTMGTALAHIAAHAGHICSLLSHDSRVVETINTTQRHPYFFGDCMIHPAVHTSSDFTNPISAADLLIFAVPSHLMRDTARQIKFLIRENQSLLSATKGFEPGTHQRMSEILHEELHAIHIGALSGPNITLDLMKNLPTQLLISSDSEQMRSAGKLAFSTHTIKISVSADLRSCEYASALKNIVALEVGIATGLGLGDNFRALVFAEGMKEISELMDTMGLQTTIFYGIAGLSDIFLTCVSPFAHNYTIGVKLGAGALLRELIDALYAKGEVAEGVESVNAGFALAQQYGRVTPILAATHALMYKNKHGKDNFLAAVFNPSCYTNYT